MLEKRVVAVVNLMRHGHNQGDSLTPKGVAQAFTRGERDSQLLSNPAVVASILKRGLVYFASVSPLGRARQTEHEYYKAFSSHPVARGNLVGALSRPNSSLVAWSERIPPEKRKLLDRLKKKWPEKPEEFFEKMIEGKHQLFYPPRKELESSTRRATEMVAAITRGKGDEMPVFWVSLVSHSGLGKGHAPRYGPLESMIEELTRINLQDWGGFINHAEGMQEVVYADGSREVFFRRQNPHNDMNLPLQ